MVTLADLSVSQRARLVEVGGERTFRRRLLELGFVPGTVVTLRKVAPMGDPLEFEVRHCRISIRRREAQAVTVEPWADRP